MSKRVKVVLGVVAALVLAFAVGSIDWCRHVEARAPQPLLIAGSKQPLRAGAASVALSPPFPVPRAGYARGKPTATRAATPINARAIVVDAAGTSWGIVVLDALLIPTEVADEVRAKAGLSDVWVVASHTHSSFGGYDRRWVAELAATGGYQQAARDALVTGALEALKRAGASLRQSAIWAATVAPSDFSVPRSGAASDGRLTRVAFLAPDGMIGELIIASAHPTTVGRDGDALDADWPGQLAAAREASGGGVSLVVQGAAGNASVSQSGKEAPAAWAQRIAGEVAKIPVRSAGEAGLVLVRMGVSLPEVDAKRAVPFPFRGIGKNVLCTQCDNYAAISLVRLGHLALLSLPGEVSFGAGRPLEQKAGADRLVSLAGGYLGYVESAEATEKGEGESKRQYYAPGLAAALEEGAKAAYESMALVVGAQAMPPKPLLE